MAYNAVSQADLEVASNATDSDASLGSSPHKSTFQQLPLDGDHIGGGNYLQPAKSAEDSSIGRLGSLIRSMTSTSYDMVEEDDYDIADPPTDRRSNSLRRLAPLDTRAVHVGSPEPPLRSPITDTPTPLSHPTPDLQSLQGAYLNNVERLERSAEQLSSSSADIGSEIRKMDREQKRRSVSSVSNSVRDSNPMKGTVPSSQGSIISASRLAQVSEHKPEEHYVPSIMRVTNDPAPPSTQPPILPEPDFAYYDQYSHIPDEIQRPSSAASGDTFQQARVLFTDFDGVHYVPQDRGQVPGRQVSLTRPPLASGPESFKEPQTGEDMVYYPAPVPMRLNLPPRLSQKPSSEREKRRTRLLGPVLAENRKSAPWLSGQALGDVSDHNREKQPADIPPQLRASVFFEQPAAPLDVEVKQASAVATLDSILDASTSAPVTAFTDHPYAGPVGSEVYAKHKASSKDLAAQRNKHMSRSTLRVDHPSSESDVRVGSFASHHLHNQTESDAADLPEGTSLRDSAHDGHNVEHDSQKDDKEEGNEQEVPFTGPPSTLLAELEMRKHELRQRQRTAATSIGMHSTLLQLDAVAQKQSEHRRHRPVTLAWEDPDVTKQDDDGDDDVPLGMLFPEKATAADDNRPLGLMERRQLEESEPLSRRRARLRGEPPPPPARSPDNRPTTMYTQNPQEPATDDSGDEGETLAERLKRLKTKDRRNTATGSEFADEILAEIDHMNGDDKEKGDEEVQEEETLGQRRARLQKESESRNSTLKVPRYRRSMADLLHARRPVTDGRPASKEAALHRTSTYQPPYGHRMSFQPSTHLGQPVSSRYPQYQGNARASSLGYGAAHPNTFYSDAILGMNHLSYVAPTSYQQKVARAGAETGQREIIDRWRQSIV
ncbi:uncharacterized protein BDW43DRAFT_112919 [Aspergillus alliaceus]|uniref:uncharacterized protein n=1 Tax=Petromyces alliaceus TaxID=209559 RepID=UPI0012A53AB6|nr:uncharacterized protein BDW43DRAFT_112919 [Aspergillus alliaceus]KAB8232325.1 hypothetical protein BDW43DRAFT_112919 [Aspergillus alliaceus]